MFKNLIEYVYIYIFKCLKILEGKHSFTLLKTDSPKPVM